MLLEWCRRVVGVEAVDGVGRDGGGQGSTRVKFNMEAKMYRWDLLTHSR